MNEELGRYKGKRIAVLMGGNSGEREISLKSGARVLDSLLSQGFDAIEIDVDRDIASRLVAEGIDVALIMLHGRYGEDGTIQGLLEQLGIPYTGSGVLASALAMDKLFSKKLFGVAGIPTPECVEISTGSDIDEVVDIIKRALSFPVVVKPVDEGSSLGVVIASDETRLREAIEENRRDYSRVFAERFVEGTSVTVGIVGMGQRTRALPVLELRARNEFYDYEAKYTPGMTEFICPARLEKNVYDLTQHYALSAHNCLGCRGFSRVDIEVDESGTPYVLEVNTIPGMTKLSDLPAAAEEGGMSYGELVSEILRSASPGFH